MSVQVQFRARPELRASMSCRGDNKMFAWTKWSDCQSKGAATDEASRLNAKARGKEAVAGEQVFEYRVKP